MVDASEPAAMGREGCPPDVRDAYLDRARLVTFRRGQTILAEGSSTSEVYLIRSGRVNISLFSRQGREVILREMRPDCILGELAALDLQPRSCYAVALTDSVLAQMDRKPFLDFLGEVPRAGLWMSQLLASRVRDLTERTFELSTLPVAGRLQSELLRLVLETGASGDRVVIEDVPTHADLAARIGTHREAVTRELNLLAGEGILRQSRRQVEVLSVAKLRSCHERFQR
jgi:CRP/FNR family cyclic AMP-dependent transcriptional regulator